MAVYILNNMTIHDRAEYETYLRGFMEVFRKYQGEVLAVADAPGRRTAPRCSAGSAGGSRGRPCVAAPCRG